MASASTITAPVTVIPPAVQKATLAHKLLSDLSAAPAVFQTVVSALENGTAFTGPLASLESFREDLVSAYMVFTKVAAFIKAMQAVPAA